MEGYIAGGTTQASQSLGSLSVGLSALRCTIWGLIERNASLAVPYIGWMNA